MINPESLKKPLAKNPKSKSPIRNPETTVRKPENPSPNPGYES
jgi:hypothetical protein